MDIKIVDQKGEEIKQEIKEPVTPSEFYPSEGEILIQEVGKLFDFKPSEIAQNKEKIKVLIEYAKMKTEDHSPMGIKWAIRSLATKLGTPPLGEKLISYLERFAFLELETKRLEEEKQKFLKGGLENG